MADELQRRGGAWMISTTSGPPQGGMLGNAMDKGAGYGPYFDHFGFSCGMEVVLGNFAMDVFAPVVVSAVTATLVIRELQPASGDQALYADSVVDISMTAPTIVLSALLLGCICGGGAIAFRHVLVAGRALFAKLRLPLLAALPLGGAIVGAIGIYSPQVWGNGQYVVLDIFANRYDGIVLLLSIMVLKAVATSISLGSGAIGGQITPNLVVGAALGAGYAFGVEALFPEAVEQVGGAANLRTGFALVGMAGLFAGTAHAPITAVLLVFEFTRNYGLILPVMLCSILASLVARLIDVDSIYTARLRAKGHLLAGGLEALAMQTNYVRDLMRADHDPVLDDATFEQVMNVFAGSRRDTLYVVDQRGALRGHVHIHDVKFFINDPNLTSCVIAADLTRSTDPVTPDQPLAAIFERFDDPDLEELPVVRSATDQTLIGRLTRRDVIALLSDEILGKRTLRAKLKAEDDEEATFVQLPSGTELARVAVPASCAGRTLGEIQLRARAKLTPLVLIHLDDDGREHRELLTPGTRLGAADAMIVLGSRADIDAFTASWNGGG